MGTGSDRIMEWNMFCDWCGSKVGTKQNDNYNYCNYRIVQLYTVQRWQFKSAAGWVSLLFKESTQNDVLFILFGAYLASAPITEPGVGHVHSPANSTHHETAAGDWAHGSGGGEGWGRKGRGEGGQTGGRGCSHVTQACMLRGFAVPQLKQIGLSWSRRFMWLV